jgi:serine protease Do
MLVPPDSVAAPLLEDERNTVAVFQESNRGVVHIRTSSTNPASTSREARREGVGTGFVIDDLGHVLTANHVVEGSGGIVVVLPGGQVAAARVVGTSPEFDLALLRIDVGRHLLSPLRLGDSSTLQIGQKVMAIGNGLGLHNSLSVGVVSALGRTLRGAPTALEASFIQTDAAINPGNSGGPLLNSSGEVVGINDALVSSAQSIGFAIPIELARSILPDLLQMGHVYRPSLGFSGTILRAGFPGAGEGDKKCGFLVQEVLANSPAARAGLRAAPQDSTAATRDRSSGGDVILEVNGECVTGAGEIQRAIAKSGPGQTLVLRVYREGRYLNVRLTMPEMVMPPVSD